MKNIGPGCANATAVHRLNLPASSCFHGRAGEWKAKFSARNFSGSALASTMGWRASAALIVHLTAIIYIGTRIRPDKAAIQSVVTAMLLLLRKLSGFPRQ